jgi:hypothetical protein
MPSKDKDEKDGADKKTNEASGSGKDASDDEGEIGAVKPEHGEPDDNLKRRADWFQKRHGGS